MIVLQGAKLTRTFGGEALFSEITITIQDRSRIGLVGRNGSGKSTLLKLLAGIEKPDGGEVHWKKGCRIAYMDQHSAIDSENTLYEELESVFSEELALVREIEATTEELSRLADQTASKEYENCLKRYDQLQEAALQKNAYAIPSKIKMVLAGFQFQEEQYQRSIQELSGGQRTRLALAKTLLEEPDVLILDEPTNHLDIETLRWLESELPKYKGAILIVSHDRYFLDAITNETYEMTGYSLEHYAGNYSYYLKESTERFKRLEKQYIAQQKEIKRLEEFIRKNIVRASTTKRAQSRRKFLEKMERIDPPKGKERSAHIHFHSEKNSGQDVLTVRDLMIGYDAILSGPISFQLKKGQSLAVVGPNGVGKSTLLKTLIQKIPKLQGEVKVGSQVSMGYYDQELGNLRSKKDVLHEIWDEHPTQNEEDIRTLLGTFLFSGEDVKLPVSQLSGGEKARLELAKLSLDHDNCLLLDEPTNHLDIDSKEVLEEALLAYDGTILFVSHDRYFINRLADAVLEITAEGSTLYLGNYDYYLHKKMEQAERHALLAGEKTTASDEEIPAETNKRPSKSRDAKRYAKQLERKVEAIEKALHAKESELKEIEQALSLPENFSKPELLQDLSKQYEVLKAEHEALYSQWEEAYLALEESQ